MKRSQLHTIDTFVMFFQNFKRTSSKDQSEMWAVKIMQNPFHVRTNSAHHEIGEYVSSLGGGILFGRCVPTFRGMFDAFMIYSELVECDLRVIKSDKCYRIGILSNSFAEARLSEIHLLDTGCVMLKDAKEEPIMGSFRRDFLFVSILVALEA